jgi:thermolysin
MRRWGASLVFAAVTACATPARGEPMTHVRTQRLHHGVPVLGGEQLAHYDGAGRLVSSHRKSFAGLDALDPAPSVAKDVAIATAKRAFSGQIHASRLVVTKPRAADAAILAWEITLRAPLDDVRIDVDAHTGLIARKTSLRMHERGSGTGVFGDTRAIEYTHDHGENVMVDRSHTMTIATYDADHETSFRWARVFTSPDGRSWDTRGSASGAAVDAAYHIGLAVDFFERELDRKTWDGHEDEVSLLIHYGRDFDNAQYSPIDHSINFGDGGEQQYPLAAFLDIVAHEYTHGITQQLSGLDYDGESGALNEAISDIFGACVEHDHSPDEHRNWLHGEGSLRNQTNIDGADRDFTNPHNSSPPQPAHMSELQDPGSDTDNGYVHANSGIVNHAAYLMTVGGTNPVSNITVKNGIGWKKLALLFYQANKDYLNSHSSFEDAANATLDTARELDFSHADLQTIQCAWIAVGVLEGDCDQPIYSLSDDDDDATDDDAASGGKTKSAASSKSSKSGDSAAPAPSCTASPGRGQGGWLFVLAGLYWLIRSRGARGHADKR